MIKGSVILSSIFLVGAVMMAILDKSGWGWLVLFSIVVYGCSSLMSNVNFDYSGWDELTHFTAEQMKFLSNMRHVKPCLYFGGAGSGMKSSPITFTGFMFDECNGIEMDKAIKSIHKHTNEQTLLTMGVI